MDRRWITGRWLAASLVAWALLAPAAPAAAGPAPSWTGFDYKQAADQNRYLVREKDAILPAHNMEPEMPHWGQMQQAIDRLQARGFCAGGLEKACPKCQVDRTKEAGCRRPNILLFLVDDMGWGDFGAFGGGASVGAATPAVDKLARQGLLLTSTYAQPTCSPTRATLHTGQLPVHHGVLYPPMYGDPGGLNVESITLPWLLKKAGYRTQGVGKWHMGENRENLPQEVGYDDYLGFLSVSDMYTEWRDVYYNPEVVRDEVRTTYMDNSHFSHYMVHATATPNVPAEILAKIEGEKSDEKKSPGCEALAEITLPWEADVLEGQPNRGETNRCWVKPENASKKVSIADLDQIWADYSVSFIQGMKEKKQPWFLYHATRGCHFDNYNNLDFHGGKAPLPGNRRGSYARTLYSDCTVEMDQILGRLMQTLEDTGQAEDTFVFFTSDNGPEDEIPPHGHTPFRGGKGDTWEGGVRVPGVAFWPGMVEGGRVSDGLFDLADLYTTSLTLAGIDYAHPTEDRVIKGDPWLVEKIKKRYLYGVDQTSFLVTPSGASHRRSVLHWYLTNFSAVRMDELKAHRMVSEPIGVPEGFQGGLSGVNLDISYLWMFNLHEDPKERNNLNIRHLWAQHLFSGEFGRFLCVLAEYPPHLPTQPLKEVMYQSEIEELRQNLSKWITACHPFGRKSS